MFWRDTAQKKKKELVIDGAFLFITYWKKKNNKICSPVFKWQNQHVNFLPSIEQKVKKETYSNIRMIDSKELKKHIFLKIPSINDLDQ